MAALQQQARALHKAASATTRHQDNRHTVSKRGRNRRTASSASTETALRAAADAAVSLQHNLGEHQVRSAAAGRSGKPAALISSQPRVPAYSFTADVLRSTGPLQAQLQGGRTSGCDTAECVARGCLTTLPVAGSLHLPPEVLAASRGAAVAASLFAGKTGHSSLHRDGAGTGAVQAAVAGSAPATATGDGQHGARGVDTRRECNTTKRRRLGSRPPAEEDPQPESSASGGAGAGAGAGARDAGAEVGSASQSRVPPPLRVSSDAYLEGVEPIDGAGTPLDLLFEAAELQQQ